MAASFLRDLAVALSLSAAAKINAVAAAPDSDDLGYEMFVEEGGDLPRTCYRIWGLPPAAKGTFIISGPGKFEMGGYKFESFFDGYGRINRFELEDSKLCYTGALLNTSYYKQASKLGRISNGLRFMGTEPELPACPGNNPFCFVTGIEGDNNWVNLLPINKDKGLLMTDSPFMVELDYETLNVGAYKWKDNGGYWPNAPGHSMTHFFTTGSAHPLRRAGTKNTWVGVLSEIGPLPGDPDKIEIYNIDGDTMKRSILAEVPSKGVRYFHSFGVSKNYVVLPCNLKMDVPKMASGLMINAFKPDWAGIKVVDWTGKWHIFETEAFFHVHIANTFENETGISMDLGTWRSLPFSVHSLGTEAFLNKAERDKITPGDHKFERIHMHMKGPNQGKVTREVLWDRRQVDFFQINPYVNGLPYCFYYAVEWFHNDKNYASMAILKHDVCRGRRTYWHREQVYPTEPKFIPSGTEKDLEDEGVLTFVALNGRRKKSDFVVVNAATMRQIAIVELGVHIPFLAHGQFIPAAAQEELRKAQAAAMAEDNVFQV